MSCTPALSLAAHKPLQLRYSENLQQFPTLKTTITKFKDFKIHFSKKKYILSDSR